MAVLSAVAWLGQQRTVTSDPVLLTSGPPADVAPAAAPEPGPTSRSASRTPVAPAAADPAWVRRTALAAGIPEPAVAAYARATLGAPEGCDLGWTTLAGIGWVESHHATIDGRTVGADGRPSTPIVGPALDGTGPVAAIPVDGAWDRATGPMQFITSTWQQWGRDGDGDGVADPQDLDDAAAAAAAYLCGTGYDLTTAAGWTAAVRAYNHSDAYVLAVHSAATTYAERTR
nr:lytic murein transglycosylase [Nocardioides flavescens]